MEKVITRNCLITAALSFIFYLLLIIYGFICHVLLYLMPFDFIKTNVLFISSCLFVILYFKLISTLWVFSKYDGNKRPVTNPAPWFSNEELSDIFNDIESTGLKSLLPNLLMYISLATFLMHCSNYAMTIML